MKLIDLLFYNWQMMRRHPLLELILYFKIILIVIRFFLLVFIFIAGALLIPIIAPFIPSWNNHLGVFSYVLFSFLIIDFIVKFFTKREKQFYPYIRRFPNSEKKILLYFISNDLFRIWNFYLVVFFFYYIATILYPLCGFSIAFFSLLVTYLFQLFISQLVFYIETRRRKFVYALLCVILLAIILFFSYRMEFSYMSPIFLYLMFFFLVILFVLLTKINSSLIKYVDYNDSYGDNIFLLRSDVYAENNIVNYIYLSVKMIVRSQTLRKQLVSCLVLTAFYLYLYGRLSVNMEGVFLFNVISVFLISTFFPLVFNQYLFSAEASYFDHLMIIPHFKNMLIAKYILYLCMSIIPAFLLLLFNLQSFDSVLLFVAALIYALGVITLLSFISLLFAETKIELCASSRSNGYPPLGQTFIVLITYLTTIFLIVISSMISVCYTIYFMLVAGGVSILSSNRWFNFLYKKFYMIRYDRMEKFRKQ